MQAKHNKRRLLLFVVVVVVVFGGIALIGGLTALGRGAKGHVPEHAVLVVDLTQPLTDYGARDPGFAALFGEGEYPLPAHEAAAAVRAAAEDERIEAFLIRGGANGSLASVDMLREALQDARAAGKHVVAHLGSANERMLWLASVADDIWLDPLGLVEFDGWSADILYFGDALRELGVEVQVTRVGKYKSAVEPYMLGHMSDENREQLTDMLLAIERKILGDIATARGLAFDELAQWSHERGWFTSRDAVQAKLATRAAPFAELLAELRELTDTESGEPVPEISLADYARSVRKSPKDGAHVRVIVAEGEIIDGSNDGGIGGDDLARELRAAREDEDTRAVVLRVDSPGGSATASDVIRSEVLALKAAGKPVIVSMGSLAASGGYWISANADVIVATPSTITGSIGVFGMLPNVEKLAEQHGLRAERVASSPLAGVGSMWKHLDDKQLALMQGFVDEIYERFLDLVAEGRKLDRAVVAEIAQGRIWTGARAVELGLVDELGDLDRAITLARERAGLDADAPVRMRERKVDWLDEMLEEVLRDKTDHLVRQTNARLAPALPLFDSFGAALERIGSGTRVFARLPFDVVID